ncbi:hypothetical protein [Polyangium fumosum]|uniref:Uncharacterized protein n=1 Tax=Polyangium fumosum TaxID=889272 RepID=A0A4U1JKC8_9BACT|nr:hypothetical protein [Polyangium fumosum]TKD13222.1 hypothetical protein E8A74_01330 [Polyangium fumosum]
MTERREEALSGGAIVRFGVPAGAVEERAEALPRIEVSSLKGARVGLRAGFVDEAGLRLRVACVEAPSDRFAPGVEEIVLGMATSIARGAASDGITLDRWDAEGITRHEGRFEQALTGQGTRGERPVTLRGWHVLGFEGAASEAVLCTFVCEEPRAGERCAALVANAELTSLVPPPPPSLLVRTILMAAERPREAALLGLGIGVLLVAVLLARRPRPSP